MNDSAVKEILTKLSEYGLDDTTAPLHVPDILRKAAWAIVKFLGSVADALYVGIAHICDALSFAKSDGLQELVNSYSFILQALLIVTLVGTGLFFLVKKADTQTSIALNVVIMIVVLTSMPLITSEFSALTTSGTNGFLSQGAKTYQSDVAGNYYATGGDAASSGTSAASITSIVIANNMVDLIEVDKNVSAGGAVTGLADNKGYINRSSILDGNWKKIKITSVMDYDHGNLKNDDIWDQNLTQPELGTGSDLEDMDGFFDSLNDYYYRWQVVSWFNIFANLLIMVCVLFFVSLKCATLIFGIAAAQIYMPFIAATDLAGGQRIKAAIRHFFSLFGAILLCIALMGLYFVGFSWIESHSFGLSGATRSFVRIVLQIALAWMVINGPDIIEQIIGIDVGLRSGWQAIMGLRAAGQVAAGAGRAAVRTGRTAAKAGSVAANKVFGKKTAPAMPPGDGKRHGGLKGAVNGENAELKQFAKQERENYLNRAAAAKATPQTAAVSGNDNRTEKDNPLADKKQQSNSNTAAGSVKKDHSSPTDVSAAAFYRAADRTHDKDNLKTPSSLGNKTGDVSPTPTSATRKSVPAAERQFNGQNNLYGMSSPDVMTGKAPEAAKPLPNTLKNTAPPDVTNPVNPVHNSSADTTVKSVQPGPSVPAGQMPQTTDSTAPSVTSDFARQPVDFAKPRHRQQRQQPQKKG